MKEYLFILSSLLMTGCNLLSNTQTKQESYKFKYQVDYCFLDWEEDNQIIKSINSSTHFHYRDIDNNNRSDDSENFCQYFGVNFDSLIGEDILEITHSNNEVYILTSYPSTMNFTGIIYDIDIIYSDIYELILHKNNNEISYEFLDKNFKYNNMLNNYCLTLENERIIQKNLDEYEEGTKLYLSYNKNIENNNHKGYLYDYNPR